MEELTRLEERIMQCIWDYQGEVPFLDLIETVKEKLNKDYKRTSIPASSPTFAVMIESASPTVTVSICSMINGMINRTRSLFENILFLALSVISILFPFFFCVLKIISVFCLLFYSFYLITLLILFKV
mgnify:CR=1 FL=1